MKARDDFFVAQNPIEQSNIFFSIEKEKCTFAAL